MPANPRSAVDLGESGANGIGGFQPGANVQRTFGAGLHSQIPRIGKLDVKLSRPSSAASAQARTKKRVAKSCPDESATTMAGALNHSGANSKITALTVSLFGNDMMQLAVRGANGKMCLLTQQETDTGRECRSVRLQASGDGKSVILVETDERKVGIQREYRFEITTGELIALIRGRGAELPEEINP